MIRRLESREEISRGWPVVKTLLEPAIDRSRGVHSLATIYADLMTGDLQLWVAGEPVELACVTQIRPSPTEDVTTLNLFAAGGRNLPKHMETGFQAIESWGRSLGCTRARIEGRREWKRVSGYAETAIVLEKDL